MPGALLPIWLPVSVSGKQQRVVTQVLQVLALLPPFWETWLEFLPHPWFQLGPTPTIRAISGMNQWMGELSLWLFLFFLCSSGFQMNECMDLQNKAKQKSQ